MRRLRAAGALLALGAITVGVPIVLIAIAGYPLPTRLPNWSRVLLALRQRDIPAEVVLKVIATLVWIAWVQLAWALVWEIAVNVRSAGANRTARPAPFVPGALTIGIGRLVATVLAVGIVVSSVPKPALATRGVMGAARPPLRQPAFVTAPLVAQVAAPVWTVEHGETLWIIAETALGDGSRVGEILELNPTIGSARNLRVGMHVRLPADAQLPKQRPAAEPAQVPEFGAAETVTIQAGDNLWNLSKQRLGQANGYPVEDAAIVEYLDEVVADNADVVEDPDLIYPGEQFEFRAIGTAPAPPIVVPADPPPVPSSSTSTPPPTSALPPPLPTSAPTNSTPATTNLPAPVARAGEVASADSRAPLLTGIAGATVLASGVLLTYRRLRRRQAVRSARTIRPRPESPVLQQVENELIAAADVGLVVWAGHELNTVLTDPRVASRLAGAPTAIEVSVEHGIEILWDTPNPEAPAPWEAADQGWAWRLDYEPTHQVPARPTSAPIPGLVTVGRRDGNELMLDLEALGSVSITGDRTRALDFARSVVLELAHDDHLANSYVHVVGIDLGAEHSDRITQRSEADALEFVTSAVADTEATIAAADVESTFQLRTRHDPTGRELTVVVIDSDSAAAGAVVEAAKPHRGVAVLVVGEASTYAGVAIGADGDAAIQPLGIRFGAACVPAATAQAVSDLLAEATEEPAEVAPVPDLVDDTAAVEPSTETGAFPDDEEDLDEIAEPEILVRVLGPPAIPSHPGLKPTDVNLVVYLACRQGKSTVDQVVDAVWRGQLFEPTNLWNHVSKVRSALGARHVPGRQQGGAHVRLGPGIGTDLQLFQALFERAKTASSSEAIRMLARATDLIEGVPFDAANYDWAHQQQYHAEACRLIEDAVVALVDLALTADDVETAERATTHGLRSLPLNEPLYRCRMRVEAHRCNPLGAEAAYDELVRLMSDLDGEPFEPSLATRDQRMIARRSIANVT